MKVSQEIFANETIKFFENTQKMVFDVLPKDFTGRDKFDILVNETFNSILESKSDIQQIIINTFRPDRRYRNEEHNTSYFDFLYYELVFFNSRYNYVEPQTEAEDNSEIKSSEKIEVASTVLSSIKDLIERLPKWLQKVITVINEILGITKSLIL